jgi:hypothetical protein
LPVSSLPVILPVIYHWQLPIEISTSRQGIDTSLGLRFN